MTEAETRRPAMKSRELARSVVAMLLTQGTVIAVAFPASILLARSLGPAALGVFLLAQRFCGLSLTVLHLSAAHGLSYLSAGTDSPEKVRRLNATCVQIVIVVGPLSAAAAILFTLVQGSSELLSTTAMIAGFIPAIVYAQFVSGVLRGQLRTAAFNVVKLATPVAWCIVVTIFFIMGITSLYAFALAFVVCQWLSAALAAVVCYQVGWTFRNTSEMIRGSILFGLKAHFGQSGRDFNRFFDQVLLGFFLPFAQVGLYGVASNTASAVSGINSALIPITQPLVQRAPPERRTLVSLSILGGAACLVGLIVVGLIIPMPWLLSTFYGAEFVGAGTAARILLFAFWLDSLWSVSGAILFGLNRPTITSVSTGVAITVGIVALILLAPTYGIEGAAWASVLSYASGLMIDLSSVVRGLRFSSRPPGQ